MGRGQLSVSMSAGVEAPRMAPAGDAPNGAAPSCGGTDGSLPRGAGEWARRPAAVVLWGVGAVLLAGALRVEWPVLKGVHWAWTVLTWDGPGAPPGPVTLTFFFFPFLLVLAVAVLGLGVAGFMGLSLAARRLWRGERPGVGLLLALGVLWMPLAYGLGGELFFEGGRFGWPTGGQLRDAVRPDGLVVTGPAVLLGVGIALLCCIRGGRARG